MERKPWESSTGPRTPEGKARSSQNSFKGGVRPAIRAMMAQIRQCDHAVDSLLADLAEK